MSLCINACGPASHRSAKQSSENTPTNRQKLRRPARPLTPQFIHIRTPASFADFAASAASRSAFSALSRSIAARTSASQSNGGCLDSSNANTGTGSPSRSNNAADLSAPPDQRTDRHPPKPTYKRPRVLHRSGTITKHKIQLRQRALQDHAPESRLASPIPSCNPPQW